MKRILLFAAALILTLCMLVGCGSKQEQSTPATDPPASADAPISDETDLADNDGEGEAEEGDSAHSVYTQQIERYYTALADQWDEGTYFEQEMSPMASYYYEGNALDNVGFACMDLDGDGSDELVIGAIYNAEHSPLVFEIWMVKNGEPHMLAQSGSRNRYYMQYAEEDGVWSVAYEAENGAANHATYYLQLSDGAFEVVQGVVFDAVANESEPWFMAYDLDWDVSNDAPIDADTADAVTQAQRSNYAAPEYTPYSLYK